LWLYPWLVHYLLDKEVKYGLHDYAHSLEALGGKDTSFGLSSQSFLVDVCSLVQVFDSIITLATLAGESLTRPSVEALGEPFSGWMTKPALPVVLKTWDSYIYNIPMHDTDCVLS